MKEKFDFDDILIPPAILTYIEHRKTINIFDEDGNLPLFTAPMDTVINLKNRQKFVDNKIIPIIPRTENNFFGNEWLAIGLNEFEKLVNSKEMNIKRLNVNFKNLMGKYKLKILVDVANGHMVKLYNLAKKAKEKYPEMILMIGNVANPETYRLYSEIGVDYVRIGIGNGCFINGTKIKCDIGLKNIENISINDKVYTHKNNLKLVGNVKKQSFKGEVVNINNEIKCTKNHMFYVLHKKHLKHVTDENVESLSEWVLAEKLNSNYLLLEPNIKSDENHKIST